MTKVKQTICHIESVSSFGGTGSGLQPRIDPKITPKSVDNFVENLSADEVKSEQILGFLRFAKNLGNYSRLWFNSPF